MVYKPSTIELLARKTAPALMRLSSGLHPRMLRKLLLELGWQAPENLSTIGLEQLLIEAVASAYSLVVGMDIEMPDDETAQRNYQALATAVSALAAHIAAQASGITLHLDSQFVDDSGISGNEFFQRLIDYLIVEHLYATQYRTFCLLRMLGIVALEEYGWDDDILQSKHTRRVVHYDRIPILLTNSQVLFQKAYGWGTPAPDFRTLLERMHSLFLALGLPAYMQYPDLAKEKNLSKPALAPEEDWPMFAELIIPIFSEGEEGEEKQVGFTVFPIPASSIDGAPGLALCPYATGAIVASIPLDPSGLWLLELSGDLDLELGIGIILRPREDIRAITDLLGADPPDASGSFLMKVRRTTWPDEPLVLFTLDDGSGLSLREIYISSGVALKSAQQWDIIAELGCLGFSFLLKGTGDDGFLAKILPEEGIRADFDLVLGWSREQGICFQGSFGLEVKLPTHLCLGPIAVDSLNLAVSPVSAKNIPVEVSASITGQLGPLTITIERIGCAVAIGFPDSGGNLGLLDATLDFKPPTGVGLAIDAAGIVGGGSLEFDHANQRYAGVLALNFSEIGLVAIGLITTRMPDGSEGFSLLINIGVTFDPPIQLSFGFTLSGVGGLIGVNRTMEIDALRTGLKNRTLDSILFPDPDTVIANASQIISDLRTVFPPVEGRYVVGPMVRIGWGSPTIITAELGIFLEFPDPIRLVLMGQVEAAFPEEDKALVLIHLDILGVVDFAKEELTFQACLYDSRVMSYSLSGDSAFLLGWGQDPRFALSLGGFHPRFTPPPPPIVFADLKRLTLSISKGGGVLKLSCQAYQALTPNSLQFGARVDLYASEGGLIADGHLGFDALFYFSPFSFEVEICGGVHIKYKGVSLLDVDLTLLLSGPTPWHARGKAKIKILFVSVEVGFTFTWGRDEQITLPPVDPWVSLPEGQPLPMVLEDPLNWGTVLPAGHTMVESLRSLETEAPGQIIVHPAGRLEVRQNVVPLGVRLDKVGNAPITGHDLFDITDLRVNGDSLHPLDPVEEYFARGQFEELPTDQKLSLPAFEKMKAGVTTASSEAVHFDGAAEVKTLAYESILINQDRTSTTQEPGDVFLLSTDTEPQSDLDSGTLSDSLRLEFAQGGIVLSSNELIIITTVEENSQWRIYDSGHDRTYTVLKEDEMLSVYGEINWFDWNEAEFIVKASATRKAAQRAGPQKRFSTLRPQPRVGLDEERYCIVNALDLTPVELEPDLGAENRNLTRMAADQVLQAQLEQRPEQAGELMVIPEYEVAV